MRPYGTGDVRFLLLVYRVIIRGGGTIYSVAKRLEEPVEDVEAAVIHLLHRGDLAYRPKRRPSKKSK